MVNQDIVMQFEPTPGLIKTIKTYNDKIILVENFIKKGTEIKLHSHPDSELLSYIVKGKILININGKQNIFVEGNSTIISQNIPHSAIALEESYILDCFTPPPRELLNQVQKKEKIQFQS